MEDRVVGKELGILRRRRHIVMVINNNMVTMHRNTSNINNSTIIHMRTLTRTRKKTAGALLLRLIGRSFWKIGGLRALFCGGLLFI